MAVRLLGFISLQDLTPFLLMAPSLPLDFTGWDKPLCWS